MKKLKFKKEYYKDALRWFIVYPEWKGSKDDLEMVEGADILLDILSDNTKNIELEVSTDEILSYKLELVSICEYDGAYYSYNYQIIWLCNVTKFVLGDFPEVIYFRING